jgi:hypothetical protein
MNAGHIVTSKEPNAATYGLSLDRPNSRQGRSLPARRRPDDRRVVGFLRAGPDKVSKV